MIAALVVGAVAVVLIVMLLAGQRATHRRLAVTGRQLEQARTELTRRQADAAGAEVEMAELRRLLAASPAAAGDAPSPVPGASGDPAASGDPRPPGDGGTAAGPGGVEAPGAGPASVLEALWALTALDQTRSRRFAEAVSTAVPSASAPGGITAGLEEEVARLRDDTGTPGTLRVALDTEPAPGDAELLLRSVQALLAVLSRHCQGYDLYVHRWEQRLLAVLVCEAFDGPDSVADETSEVLAALAAVDGRIDLDRDPQGRLRARLSLPATGP